MNALNNHKTELLLCAYLQYKPTKRNTCSYN